MPTSHPCQDAFIYVGLASSLEVSRPAGRYTVDPCGPDGVSDSSRNALRIASVRWSEDTVLFDVLVRSGSSRARFTGYDAATHERGEASE